MLRVVCRIFLHVATSPSPNQILQQLIAKRQVLVINKPNFKRGATNTLAMPY